MRLLSAEKSNDLAFHIGKKNSSPPLLLEAPPARVSTQCFLECFLADDNLNNCSLKCLPLTIAKLTVTCYTACFSVECGSSASLRVCVCVRVCACLRIRIVCMLLNACECNLTQKAPMKKKEKRTQSSTTAWTE